MKRISLFVVLILALIFAAAMVVSHASQSSDLVKIVMIKGNPKIMKAQKAEWEKCVVEMPVVSGDRIRTSKDELVDIAFTLKSTVAMRIEQNSDVFIKNNVSPYSMDLLNGAVMASIKSLPRGSGFEVRTPTAVSGARGTAWRSATDGNKSIFDAFERSIYVKGIDAAGKEMDGELKVNSGFRIVVDKFERPSRVERLSGADRARWSEWQSEMRHAAGAEGMSGKLDKIDDLATRAEQTESRRQGGVIEIEDVVRIEERTTDTGRGSTSGYRSP